MSRTPAHASGAGTPNAARPAASSAAPTSHLIVPPARRNLIIGSSAAGSLLLLVGLFVWKPWAPHPPRLNEPIPAIAKFAASSGLGRLPFEQQRQYMELLDEKDEGVEEAYEQGALSDQEYRRSLQLAWYGEHLKKMDNFYSKPPTLRLLYLDKQIDKKIRKKLKKKADPGSDAKSPLRADEIDRDDSTEDEDIKRWPAEVRHRWSEYRAAMAARKQFWKDYRDRNKGEDRPGEAANETAGAGADSPETGGTSKTDGLAPQ